MPTKQRHIIQKQTLEVTFPDVASVRQWEINHQREMQDAIQKTLDRCFEEYDQEDRYLVMDKLELDLGMFSPENLQAEMPERLLAALQKELANHSITSKNNWADTSADFERKGEQQFERSFSPTQGRIESFLFFLQKGYLPWWGTRLTNWDLDWLKKLNDKEWLRIKDFFLANDDIPIQRITQQFGDGFLTEIVQGLNNKADAGEPWEWLKHLIIDLEEKYKELKERQSEQQLPSSQPYSITFPDSVSIIRQKYWAKWIRYVLGIGYLPQLKELFPDNSKLQNLIRFSIQSKTADSKVFSLGEIPSIWRTELDQLVAFAEKNYSSDHPDHEGDAAPGKSSVVEKKSENISTRKRTYTNGETLYINDAGLVLLHPFLPQLFRNCGFTDEKKFTDVYFQTMAVYAMHYLTTGNATAPEYELLLPKLFCGLEWEQPLQPIDGFPQLYRDACDELLREVIRHWTALKSTSPDGLRQAFLQRNGKLENEQGNWQLLVEEKAQDVLLGRLPWGISVIKYPWMPGMLSVTWK